MNITMVHLLKHFLQHILITIGYYRVFVRVPKSLWSKENNRRQFFDWLGKQLGYKNMDDWYSINMNDIAKFGGDGLMSHYYNNSPSSALLSVYPEHNWDFKKFVGVPKRLWQNKNHSREKFFGKGCEQAPHSYWTKIENRVQFFTWLGLELGIHKNGRLVQPHS